MFEKNTKMNILTFNDNGQIVYFGGELHKAMDIKRLFMYKKPTQNLSTMLSYLTNTEYQKYYKLLIEPYQKLSKVLTKDEMSKIFEEIDIDKFEEIQARFNHTGINKEKIKIGSEAKNIGAVKKIYSHLIKNNEFDIEEIMLARLNIEYQKYVEEINISNKTKTDALES